MKLQLKKDSTSVSIYVFIQDSSVATGAGLTGLVYNSSSLVAYYVRAAGTATQITLATLAAANSAYSSGGFKEIDATNMPGVYRLDLPDAVIATGVNSVVVMLKGATNMAPVVLEIQLVAYDPQDTVRLGLTALPNAAAEAAGGLFTRGTGAGQINQDGNGRIDANTVRVGGTVQTAGDLAAMLTLIDDFVDTEVAAIKAKTDNLPSDPADASDIASSFSTVNSTLATIAAYIDTEVAAILAAVDTEIAAIKAKTDNLPAAPAATGDIPTANQNADALLDRANGVESSYTPRQALRLILAALAGKISGAATTNVKIRDVGDTKDRIDATVDADGNRTAVTLDAT